MSEDFKDQYLKFKKKYLELKNQEEELYSNKTIKSNIYRNTQVQSGGSYITRRKITSNGSQKGGGENDKKDIILFKAEWCPHCKHFKPIWKKLENEFKGKYNFITYDSDSNKDEMKKYNITGYPTLMSEYGGETYEFVGPMDYEKTSAFIKKI